MYKPVYIKKYKETALLLSVLFILVLCLLTGMHDTDEFFLIATGREMLKNGIIRTNPWTIDRGCSIIVQQWLYCIGIAVADKGGELGIALFFGLQIALYIAALLPYFKNAPLNAKILLLITTVVLLFPFASTRPQVTTITALLVLNYALDQYEATLDKAYLLIPPLLTLLIANIHGALWPSAIAVILTHVFSNSTGRKLLRVPVLVSAAASAVTSVANPYGIKGALYVFSSFSSRAMDYVSINELGQPALLSITTLYLSIAGLAGYGLHKNGNKAKISTILLILGFGIPSLFSLRNCEFLIVGIVALLRDVVESNAFLRPLTKQAKRTLSIWLTLTTAAFLTFALSTIAANDQPTDISIIQDYVSSKGGKQSKVFSGFNNGAYLEYMGHTNIYIDARPELYTETFAKKKDILKEYSKFAVYGRDVVTGQNVTKEDMSAWFDGYSFDFVIVDAHERFLKAYMMTREDYALVSLPNCSTLQLYEKTR